MAVLAQNGVKVIETKDQPLDTDFHEAIAVIPAPSEAQKGKILDCVQTGYTLNVRPVRAQSYLLSGPDLRKSYEET